MGRLLNLSIESRLKAYRTENSQNTVSPKSDDLTVKCASIISVVVFGRRVPVRVDVRRRSPQGEGQRGLNRGGSLFVVFVLLFCRFPFYPSNLPKMGRLLILSIESRPKAYRAENSQDVFSPKYDGSTVKCVSTVSVVVFGGDVRRTEGANFVFGGRVPFRVDVRRRFCEGMDRESWKTSGWTGRMKCIKLPHQALVICDNAQIKHAQNTRQNLDLHLLSGRT